MSKLYLIVGLVIAIGAVILWFRSHAAPEYLVHVSDIPRIIAALSAFKSDPAYAVLLMRPPGATDDTEALNLELSVEEGRVVFDWELLSPWNKKDEARFTEFARSAGYIPVRKEDRGKYHYWRVDEGDVAALCRDVIIKMYQRPDSEPLYLLFEGFEWTDQ